MARGDSIPRAYQRGTLRAGDRIIRDFRNVSAETLRTYVLSKCEGFPLRERRGLEPGPEIIVFYVRCGRSRVCKRQFVCTLGRELQQGIVSHCSGLS